MNRYLGFLCEVLFTEPQAQYRRNPALFAKIARYILTDQNSHEEVRELLKRRDEWSLPLVDARLFDKQRLALYRVAVQASSEGIYGISTEDLPEVFSYHHLFELVTDALKTFRERYQASQDQTSVNTAEPTPEYSVDKEVVDLINFSNGQGNDPEHAGVMDVTKFRELYGDADYTGKVESQAKQSDSDADQPAKPTNRRWQGDANARLALQMIRMRMAGAKVFAEIEAKTGSSDTSNRENLDLLQQVEKLIADEQTGVSRLTIDPISGSFKTIDDSGE